MSSLRRAVAGAAAVSLGGGVVGAAANLVLAVIVGRALGAAGAGPFFQMMAFVAIASNVLELGADTGLVRYVSAALALDRGDRVKGLVRAAVLPVVAVAALVVAAGALAAPWLADLVGGDRSWVVLLLTFSGLGALLSVVLGAVRATSSAVPFTLLQSVGLPTARLALIGVCLAAGAATWRPLALAWLAPLTAALLVAGVLLVRAERRHRGRRPAAVLTRAEQHDFWSFSGPRGVSAAAEILLEWADVLIVAVLCTPAEAGVYAVVTRAARSAELVQQASRVAVGPLISAALAERRLDRVRRLHTDVSVGTAVLSWPFFVIAAYFAPELLALFGEEFAEGATALRILCVGLALAYGAGSVQSILLMGGRSTAQLGNKVGCLVVNVGLNLALVPMYGINGAAIAWAVVLVLDAAMAWLQILAGLRLRLRVGPAFFAGGGAAAAALVVCALADGVLSDVGAPVLLAPAVTTLVVLAGAAAGALVTARRLRPTTLRPSVEEVVPVAADRC
jgi:O-antigen/teichoic acid export membrane protein